MFLSYLLGRRAEHPQSYHGWVDVRDCALAQVKCMQVPEAAGHRFIMWAGAFKPIEVAKHLHAEFASQGWPISLKESRTPASEGPNICDIAPVKSILGMEFRSL
jgi:nucleoside-diphosphate-sugar epimerase